MKAITRVYRLAIEYPEGSRELGWEPEGWDGYVADLVAGGNPDRTDIFGDRVEDEDWREFRWPRERAYLSKSGADYAASVFRKYGATVEVEPSEPVVWPGGEPR